MMFENFLEQFFGNFSRDSETPKENREVKMEVIKGSYKRTILMLAENVGSKTNVLYSCIPVFLSSRHDRRSNVHFNSPFNSPFNSNFNSPFNS